MPATIWMMNGASIMKSMTGFIWTMNGAPTMKSMTGFMWFSLSRGPRSRAALEFVPHVETFGQMPISLF